uniref:RING-type domain-containing protein n=1 Tax=Meloidogyne incognita TaxID=6306 RepID=A0A914N0G2_MELIC
MLRYILIFLFFNSLCYTGKAELAIFDKFVKYLLIERNVQTQLFAFDVENGLDVLRGIHEDIVDGLIKRFHPKQLFFEDIPIFNEGFYYNHQNKDEEICPICLEKFKINDYVYKCSKCKVYHVKCIARWSDGFPTNDTNEPPSCPACREKIIITPKLTVKQKHNGKGSRKGKHPKHCMSVFK